MLGEREKERERWWRKRGRVERKGKSRGRKEIVVFLDIVLFKYGGSVKH